MNKNEYSYRINPRISLSVNLKANSNMRMIAQCFKTMFQTYLKSSVNPDFNIFVDSHENNL